MQTASPSSSFNAMNSPTLPGIDSIVGTPSCEGSSIPAEPTGGAVELPPLIGGTLSIDFATSESEMNTDVDPSHAQATETLRAMNFVFTSRNRRGTASSDKFQFTCPFAGCGKSFVKKYRLNEHSRVHTDERPFSCPVTGCSKSFRWRSSWVSHKESHKRKELKMRAQYQSHVMKAETDMLRPLAWNMQGVSSHASQFISQGAGIPYTSHCYTANAETGPFTQNAFQGEHTGLTSTMEPLPMFLQPSSVLEGLPMQSSLQSMKDDSSSNSLPPGIHGVSATGVQTEFYAGMDNPQAITAHAPFSEGTFTAERTFTPIQTGSPMPPPAALPMVQPIPPLQHGTTFQSNGTLEDASTHLGKEPAPFNS